MFFKITCNIIKVQNKDLLIEIDDEESLLRFQKNLNLLYKNNININSKNKIYKIKYNNNTKFDIKKKYNNLIELIGLNIVISGQSKYYSFSYKDEVLNEQTNTFITITKNKKGYILYANNIIENL